MLDKVEIVYRRCRVVQTVTQQLCCPVMKGGDHHVGCYTKRGLLYKTRVGEGCIVENLEGTCGASLGWGRAEGQKKKEERGKEKG